MASRWIDSGIDWANLDLFEDRTSHVIDELYRAYKEKEQMLLYYTDKTSTISAWDLNANTRDMNKLDELMTGLQTWLEVSLVNYSRFFDTTSNPDGQSTTGGFLKGLPYFDSTALGSLETAVGVSLVQIRTWSPIGTRIDADLLTMIYLVLKELTDIITIRNVAFVGQLPSNNLFDFDSLRWDGGGSDFSSAFTDYSNNVASGGAQSSGSLSNRFVNASSYSLQHFNTNLVDDDFRNSSNAGILITDLTVSAFGFYEAEAGNDEIAGFTYDTFSLISLVGAELAVFDEAHPFAFTEITTIGEDEFLRAQAYPIVDINSLNAIQYYT